VAGSWAHDDSLEIILLCPFFHNMELRPMRQYRLLSSCLLAILVLGCFTSNSQAQYCWATAFSVGPGQTVVFPAYITPGLTGPPGKKFVCPTKYYRTGCLRTATYCNSPTFLLDSILTYARCRQQPS
jgi:hypothetical protein